MKKQSNSIRNKSQIIILISYQATKRKC